MEETLERELPRAKRKKGSVGLIMLDIDHFKGFNDNYGHAAGDLILTRLTALLQSLVRSEDIVCRLGGEEFLMILPETNLEVARQRAELIRETVLDLRIEYGSRMLGAISVSVGVAVYPEHGSTGAEMLRKVDQALYLAKSNGRNRVEEAGALES
jgi:diguanylate cyclase (GGDEF)-like protein